MNLGRGATYLGVTVPEWAVNLKGGAWRKGVKAAQDAARRPAPAGADSYRGVPVPARLTGADATAWREGVRDAQLTA